MILVFGKTGQVAMELANVLPYGVFLDRASANLEIPNVCGTTIEHYRPTAVINAAAYTNVDEAETDADTAALINTDAPKVMAQTCAHLGIPFVHISTEYVFDGVSDVPYKPNHIKAPLSVYGRTKAAGEDAICASGACYGILRTSWVISTRGRNFVTTIAQLGRNLDQLSVVADQVGGPTPACAIANACASLAQQLITQPELSGIYHFSGTPDISRADFARDILSQAGLNCRVEDSTTQAYDTPAQRPLNSRLDCDGLVALGLNRPQWRPIVNNILEIVEKKT